MPATCPRSTRHVRGLRDDPDRRAAIGRARRAAAEATWSWDDQVRRDHRGRRGANMSMRRRAGRPADEAVVRSAHDRGGFGTMIAARRQRVSYGGSELRGELVARNVGATHVDEHDAGCGSPSTTCRFPARPRRRSGRSALAGGEPGCRSCCRRPPSSNAADLAPASRHRWTSRGRPGGCRRSRRCSPHPGREKQRTAGGPPDSVVQDEHVRDTGTCAYRARDRTSSGASDRGDCAR